ncbi:hypothetical protein BY996DRAFT_4576009 [Phakopsora pachyrhizi]|uniref:Uncharacterized protein n=1 Tax=Phakopsora pachyrhizi TaxID=170000 RepID=A0AAV0B1A1_PHAPC|nr:hypothetical protein BY996DRAFT_4583177 [Phakopsora pachyrhizi]KAI8459439.1 hypothetical protein BY996DRAFT_4576009 [Phakopsora pachyrhizi]CAH7675551.1 hypothetical protein PPACK8108_LOCUS10568 [Phakopsora pachyrhizi]
MTGDLSNFFWSYIQSLLPKIIILLVYYALCDLILLSQIVYQNQQHSQLIFNQHSQQHPHVEETGCSSQKLQTLLADRHHLDQSTSSPVD